MSSSFSKYLTITVLLVLLQGTIQARAWAPFRSFHNNRKRTATATTTTTLSSTGTASAAEDVKKSTASNVVVPAPPSWDELSTHLNELRPSEGEENEIPVPLITLYRDTNGWCPFCERVWLALQIKNIPYQETLIKLFDKPKWFVDMVPTGLVPVVLIHTDTIQQQKDTEIDDDTSDEKNDAKTKPQRVLIWESVDILRALDEYFPDTPKLVHEDDENYMKGREVMNELTAAGFPYVYNMRNTSLTMEEKEMQSANFEAKLDGLEDFLALTSDESPFFLNEISGLDVESVPTLERWRYQLPLIKDLDITDGRPNLKKWFDAMDKYEPYMKRVGGDKYSWTAVANTYLGYFGAGKDGLSEETKAIMAKVQKEATALESTFEEDPTEIGFFSKELLESGRIEAAAKLIANHEGIVKDSANKDPQSQKDLGRAEDENNADFVIRQVTANLLNIAYSDTTDELSIDEKDAATAARTVASRLCTPRDMGSPAAAVLRYELTKAASALTSTPTSSEL
jgi:glutathione S-transferase